MGWIWLFILGILLANTAAESQEHYPPGDDKTGGQDTQRQGTSPSTLQHEFRHVKVLDIGGLDKLKQSTSVGTVYFYKKRLHQLDNFFMEYEKSAGFLGAYGLSVGVVDCSAQVKALEPACKNTSEEKIYTYRYGEELLDLDLDTMFDVNSIMSNILQLALLHEVTIIQSKTDRQKLEYENAGQADIIYGYHTAIGTYEHRVFMEIAFAYHDKYKFILTTEPASIDGLQDHESLSPNTVCAMWVLYCRDRYDAANGCRSVNYRGEFNLLALAGYLKALALPRVFRYPEDGATLPCESDDSTVCVFINYPASAREKVNSVVDSIQFDIHGTARLVLIEEKEDDPDAVKRPVVTIVKVNEKKEISSDADTAFTLENVEYFLSSNLFPSVESSEGQAHVGGEAEQTEDSEQRVDEIDDMVLGVANRKRGQTDVENVPALTDKTYPTAIADSKLVVILFYLPFDAISMAFLTPYQEAAQKLAALSGNDPMAHPLVRVNCFDWTDVCDKANITWYPQIHIYKNGKLLKYQRSLDRAVLVQTVRLLQLEQPLMLKNKEEVENFVGGLLPDGAQQMTENVVLLRLSKSKKEMKAYEMVVNSLQMQMLFAVVNADVQTKIMPEAGVLHVRLTDPHQLMDKLTTNLDADSITRFLLQGQFHLLPELTHMNFPALFARQQPFGIIFTTGTDSYMETTQRVVVDVIKSGKFPDVTFCKMSIGDANIMAEKILLQYTDSMALPTFAIVNHNQGKVYVLQDTDFTKAALTAWIEGVLDGSVTATKMLKDGEWKPVGTYYNFLRKMDLEQELKAKEEPRSSGKSSSFSQRTKEAEEADADIRANLLDLQNSRLYSSKDRKSHNVPASPAAAGMEAGKSQGQTANGMGDLEASGEMSTPLPHEEL